MRNIGGGLFASRLPWGNLLVALDDKFRHPEQRAFVFRRGEIRDRGFRLNREGVGAQQSGFHGVIALQNVEDVLVANADEPSLAHDGFNGLPFMHGAVVEGVDDRHGDFAFAEVAADGFAEDFFAGGEVEHVVHNLEGHADAVTVLAELFDLFGRSAAENSAQAHADGEEAGGFAIDEVEMFLQGNKPAEFFNLEKLSLDHFLRELDQGIEDVEVTFG